MSSARVMYMRNGSHIIQNLRDIRSIAYMNELAEIPHAALEGGN